MDPRLVRHSTILQLAEESVHDANAKVDRFACDVTMQMMVKYDKAINAVPTARKQVRRLSCKKVAEPVTKPNGQIVADDHADDTSNHQGHSNSSQSQESDAGTPLNTKRARMKALSESGQKCKYLEGDDGYETYKKRGKQYNRMQLETLDHIRTYMQPERLPDGSGFLINFIAPIEFHKSLVEYAVSKAWLTYDENVKRRRNRESSYREQQRDGSACYVFDYQVAAASDAFRVCTLEFFSFLKSCVKCPCAFYSQINIMKTRRAVFPYQLINSLGEPYKKVFDLSWIQMYSTREKNRNIFRQMTHYQMKQVFAECLHKERQTRRNFGYYDDSGTEEEETEDEDADDTPSLKGIQLA